MIVTGVDFVSVPTRDLTAAMDFYANVLGLERSSMWQRPGDGNVLDLHHRYAPRPGGAQ